MTLPALRLALLFVALTAAPMTSRAAFTEDAVSAEDTEAATSETTAGKIQAIDAEAREITIKHKKENTTFTVAADCEFIGYEKEGMTLADLTIGERTRISWVKEGDKQVVHQIEHVVAKDKSREE